MLLTLYSAFRFLFELVCLGIAGYWGFSRVSVGHCRYALAILAPLAIVCVWGMWGAPNSAARLQGIARLSFELGIYALSVVFLYNTKLAPFTVPFAVLAVANAGINFFTGWLV